jgi:hypothetical protein
MSLLHRKVLPLAGSPTSMTISLFFSTLFLRGRPTPVGVSTLEELPPPDGVETPTPPPDAAAAWTELRSIGKDSLKPPPSVVLLSGNRERWSRPARIAAVVLEEAETSPPPPAVGAVGGGKGEGGMGITDDTEIEEGTDWCVGV